ncbi:uncharacterized protein PAE49_014969 [Odontesthes bonariensis]|uniref:uncharacterized protein LOC142399255 n=1 Tax=Odontesthes bonariensis TaxID=219752 RepID=UPI003F588BE4
MRRAMSGGFPFLWVPLLLTCVFQTSDNRHVHPNVEDIVSQLGNQEVYDVLSKIPITFPNGTNFDQVNITTFDIKLCTDMKEQLASLNGELQQTSRRNSQLDEEAFELRRDVRQLKMRLATCSSTASAVSGSYQTQLQTKMNELLEVFDSEIFQILKIMTLTREVATLQRKVELAASSTDASELSVLQKELEEKLNDLNAKKQQIGRSNKNSKLILEIISLENQVWDLQQTRTGTDVLPDGRELDLQEEINRKISELRDRGDTISAVLELISVRSKITVMEKMIRVHIQESRTASSDAQRQWRLKVELLKEKIMQLNDDEHNTTLTREILRLQGEMDHLANVKLTAKETLEASLREIRVNLEAEKKREEILQKQLEGADYSMAQMIRKIINIMEELRRQHHATSTGQSQDIFALVQRYKNDYAKAQSEITDLQEKLRLTRRECSGLEERNKLLKTDLEEKISELNRTDTKGALILSVIKLHGELKTLRKQISASDDKEMTSKLQRQLQQKQAELNSKTEDIERLIAKPRNVLTIIELQKQIWNLQNKNTSGTIDEINALQNRVDDLLSEIDSSGQGNAKQMMKIVTLQTQVEYLKTLLSNPKMLETTRVTELTNKLKAKEEELKQYVNELNEKNQTNAKLAVTITDLQRQLREIEKEKQAEDKATSATLSELREQLKSKEEENKNNQALIKSLQNSLNQTEAQCSAYEQKIKDLQNDLDAKIEELTSKSDTVTSLALRISTLTAQLEELNKQLQNSVSKSQIDELQRLIDEKSKALVEKTEQLKQRSGQAQRILQIIALRVEIERLVDVAANDTDHFKINALQDKLKYLIEGIQDKDDENSKLMFQILVQKDEIARLERQKETELETQAQRISDLESELENIRNQIKDKTSVLDPTDIRIANLTGQIMELHKKIKPLEEEISDLKETYDENLAEHQEKLILTKKQLEDSELQLKHAGAENYKQIMKIAELSAQLKKARKQASKATGKSITDLEERLKTQQEENRNLETTNKDLKKQVKELNTCCTVNTHCEDLQRQLQQSQEDADRLHRQLQEKDAALRKLQRDFEEQGTEKNKLQESYNNLLEEQGVLADKVIHSTKMIMDPDTAHPRIALSANKAEVSTTEDPLNVLDHPGRFDIVLGVLGETGFSSGRHYWEVSVAGKNCYHLGMASESAQRKGSPSFKPAQGYWTIVLNKQGQLRAIDKKPVMIHTESLPLTLGILLDYKQGQVSFYDSGSRSHLYTFSGQRFTDKIYAFISYCVEEVKFPLPLALVSPGSTDWII